MICPLSNSPREYLMLCISVLRQVSGRNTIQDVMESLFTDILDCLGNVNLCLTHDNCFSNVLLR